MWIPPLKTSAKYSRRSLLSVLRFPPSESGYVMSCTWFLIDTMPYPSI